MKRSDGPCAHGHEAGRCPDEKCPGYWLDADDPEVPALMDDLYLEAMLGPHEHQEPSDA